MSRCRPERVTLDAEARRQGGDGPRAGPAFGRTLARADDEAGTMSEPAAEHVSLSCLCAPILSPWGGRHNRRSDSPWIPKALISAWVPSATESRRTGVGGRRPAPDDLVGREELSSPGPLGGRAR